MNYNIKYYEKEGYLNSELLHQELKKVCRTYPNKLALVDSKNKLTYGELMNYIDSLEYSLSKKNLEKGRPVLLHLSNCIEFVGVLFALFQLGVPPVLLLPTHRSGEIKSICNLVHPAAYITTNDLMGFDCMQMFEGISAELAEIECIDASKLINRQRDLDMLLEDKRNIEVDPRDTALFLLSGGTTGTPKIIPKIHEAYFYNAVTAAKKCSVTADSVYMAVLPVAHDLALANPGVMGTLLKGGTVVMCETSSFDEAFEAIEMYGITFTTIVPAIGKIWAEVSEWYRKDLTSLKQLIIGGAKLDTDLGHTLINRFKVCIQQGYGLGEGVTCFTSLNDSTEVCINTQGRPISEGDEIIITDEQGNILPPNIPGELLERGPYTFEGYYKNDRMNETCFNGNGFFKTGDKALIREDGNIVILGRVREQINRAGENVIPSELETLLRIHPDIEDACVFGAADENLGEKSVACIISKRKEISREEICIFLYNRGVASYKYPDQIFIVDTFSCTNIGKVDKEKLKKEIMESH